jgi:hypothetical protein
MSAVPALGFLALLLNISACSFVPTVQTPIHQSEQGAIALRTFSDPEFKASHPKTLASTIMLQVLQGLRVQEQKSTLAKLITGDVPPAPAFSQDQILYLAPILTSAFSQATAEEQVTFLLTNNSSNEITHTEGALFIEDSFLYLSISQYRTPSTQPALLSKPTSSFNRPKEWELKFYPISALRNQTDRVRVSNDDTILNMLHIDFNRLAQPAESNCPQKRGGRLERIFTGAGQEITGVRKPNTSGESLRDMIVLTLTSHIKLFMQASIKLSPPFLHQERLSPYPLSILVTYHFF